MVNHQRRMRNPRCLLEKGNMSIDNTFESSLERFSSICRSFLRRSIYLPLCFLFTFLSIDVVCLPPGSVRSVAVSIGIADVHRIIPGIGIAVEVDAGEDGVPGVGGEEAAEVGVVVAGVEVLQAGFGVEALVDVGLAVEDGGAVGGERVAEGAVVVARGGLAPAMKETRRLEARWSLWAQR